ncbi:sugar ABC transporter permease, partial [Bacillus sp. LR--39]
TQGAYSYSTAVGLFKSVVVLILIFGANYIAKKFDQEGLF